MTHDSRSVPPSEEIGTGIWSLPVPVPGRLGFVCAYAVEAPGGVVLIDAGWDSAEALASLEAGLCAAGFGLEAVRKVFFTHGHPDHFGLALRLREATGAPLALHEADARATSHRTQLVRELKHRFARGLEEVGMSRDEQNSVTDQLLRLASAISYVEPDRFIFDGDVVEVTHGELIAIHTPGHSRGHICFLHAQEGVVFVGDHVLAHTTPNVSALVGSVESPLDDYLSSLRRVGQFKNLVALPGHGSRFTIGPRVQELIAHHGARLREARTAVAAGCELVLEVAAKMTWSEPFTSYDSFNRYLAARETLAHLILLSRRGIVQSTGTRPARWRPGEVR